MTTLHLLQANDSLERALPCIACGDVVVYLNTLAAQHAQSSGLERAQEHYQLGDQGHPEAVSINYSQLVTLCTRYRHCLSW